MGDLSDKGSECEDMNMMNCKNSPEGGGSCSSEDGSHLIKTCADCGTTKTPLWRGGPAGPKSLCNACGIRSRKKRRALLAIPKEDKKPKKTTLTESQSSGLTSSDDLCLKKRLMGFGSKVVLQRPRSRVTKQRRHRKLGEEEQAAILLMALSCGSVFA